MNENSLKQAALQYHHMNDRPGKIEVVPTKPYSSQIDLALAYSPGVAYPCKEIEANPEDVYKYTNKGNLVAVVSNGTAVLGLGNIGALASKPVMEGKALLFKIFAGLDCFDIEIDQKDPDKFIEAVAALEPTFGGINLEDIKAPECFRIEKALRERMNIPVMHDDQHGTAIISAAGLVNALELQGKKIEDVRLVVNGAGAAAIACTKLYEALGLKHENILMCDSKGVIRADRENLNPEKKEFATDRTDLVTLADAVRGADVFLGLSVAGVLTPEMVRTMAPKPIVFALANPNPEISYEDAMASCDDLIFATGRSDYPNQINNVLGFPYIFRGALDSGATAINEEMKLAAVYAIAELARKPVPPVVDKAYGMHNIHFGKDYIIPKPLDPRLLTAVAPAVAKAAAESGVAKRPITDYTAYAEHLKVMMGRDSMFMRNITDIVRRRKPARVVFGEGNAENMLRAAVRLKDQKILEPVLLGNTDQITAHAAQLGLDIEGIEIVNPRHADQAERRAKLAEIMTRSLCRKGMTMPEAEELMHDRNYMGMMMTRAGDADAFIAGVYSAGDKPLKLAEELIGIKPGYNTFATMHIANTRRGTLFLADTAVNATPTAAELVDITRLVCEQVRLFAVQPTVAMLSYSNFGSAEGEPTATKVSEAVAMLHTSYPQIEVDGEMQPTYALDRNLRDRAFPFNALKGKDVNTLIFPDLDSANITLRMLLEMGVGTSDFIGPIQLGLNKPVHFISTTASVADIANLATVAALDSLLVR